MRRFLYYLHGVGGANAKMLADRGLLPRFSDGAGRLIEHGVTQTPEGPGEKSETRKSEPRTGCIVAAGARPARYEPARQRWIKFCESARSAHVGLEDIDLPPGPADLERRIGIAGYEITLGDGNVWRVPLLRRWEHSRLEHVAALPQSIGAEADAAGRRRFVSKVRPEFSELDGRAEKIFAGFVAGTMISVDQLMGDAADLLSVNYRLGVEEIILLGLLTEELALAVLALAIDSPGLRRSGERVARLGLVERQTVEEKSDD